jgi:hypothetical protein
MLFALTLVGLMLACVRDPIVCLAGVLSLTDSTINLPTLKALTTAKNQGSNAEGSLTHRYLAQNQTTLPPAVLGFDNMLAATSVRNPDPNRKI